AESVKSGDTAKGAIAFNNGPVQAAALEIDTAVGAASGAQLARALVVVSALAMAGAALLLVLRRVRARSETSAIHHVSLRAVVVSACVTLIVGALLALVTATRAASVTASGNPLSAAVSSPFGTWALVALAAAAVILASALVPAAWKRLAAVIVVVVASLVLVAGFAQAGTPQPPPAEQDQKLPVGNGLQLSARITPAAVGYNTFVVGVAGPKEALAPPTGDPPFLLLRPLDGRIGTMRVQLYPQPDGGLKAENVLIPFEGRWRADLSGSTGLPADSPATFDFNIQPNPRLTNG
ncbi:MAG: hypothetical protein HQ526_09815, partial [Actinobacteria bacterium]|nr:hypothetical protein [Actinomycetota bacterium]